MSAAGKMSCKCPICGGEARWSVMKNSGRVCITHGACGVQVFARGDEADELMRDKFIAGGATQAAPNVTNVQEAGEPAPVTYVQDGEGFGVWN